MKLSDITCWYEGEGILWVKGPLGWNIWATSPYIKKNKIRLIAVRIPQYVP